MLDTPMTNCLRLLLALYGGLTVTACAQSPTAPQVRAAPASPAIADPTMAEPTEYRVIFPPPGSEKIPAFQPSPAISAAELRAGMLRLIGSLKTLADTNVPNVEKQMRAKLAPDPKNPLGRFIRGGDVTEGWGYWYDWFKFSDGRANIRFELFPQEESLDVLPKICTYDFDALAKDIRALGYEQSEGFVMMGKPESVGFYRHPSGGRFYFGVRVFVYYTEAGQRCAKGIGVSHDFLSENMQ